MKKVLKKAFLSSIPVLTGYLVLGFGFGIILKSYNYGILIAFVMSFLIYAGSMQYVAIGLMTGGASLLTVALTTLMVNARHLFYGISLLEKYKNMGKRKPYLIFSLTDETYSLVCSDNKEIEDKYKKENNTFIIDPEPAAIVKEIFERYVAEEKIIDIITDLNQRKIYSPGYYKQLHAKRKKVHIEPYNWTYNSIITILHNQAYCGDAVNLQRKNKLRNKNKIILENQYEPIISKDLYIKAQNIMVKRGKSNRVTPPEQILTGYFYYNGKSLSFNVHRNKPNNYYKNSKYHISINEKKAIEIVYIECLKYYNEIIADYETIKENFIKRNKPKSILTSLKKSNKS